MAEPMQTFWEMHDELQRSGNPCAYWGERHDWFVVCGQNRDSDSLTRSNFRSMLKALGGESDTVAIERENHWACGWVEFILVHPDDAARITKANEIREALEDYPVVDEMDWSELESTETWEYVEREMNGYDNWQATFEEVAEEMGGLQDGDNGNAWEICEAAKERIDNPPDLSAIPNWERVPTDVDGQIVMY